MVRNGVYRWHRLVTGVRVALAALFLPIMVFGFIAFPEARIVTAVAIVILSIVIAMHFRSGKEAKSVPIVLDEAGDNIDGRFYGLVTGAIELWTINVTIVLTQLAGAVIAWRLAPSRGLLSALIGGALASIVGLGIGILLDRARKSMWAQASALIRWLYVLCAVAISLVGVFLLLAFFSFV